ncbi:MAG: hypothetical protein ACOYJJ_04380 [Anaerovoracaceae bacterium]|jgi:hypothetical protein
MELIRIQGDDYDRYENLLIQRDNLRKDAGSIQIAYIKEFGDLINKSFAAKIDCIKLKKQIAFCQMSVNKGETIDMGVLNQYISKVMDDYKKQLDEMYSDTEMAKNSHMSSEATVLEVKRLYRRLVKLIHPDINPKTKEQPQLQELWQRVVSAYHANDKNELEELEVLIDKVFRDYGDEAITIEIPNIREKTEALEVEIEKIRSTDPYQYRYLLENDELVQEKKEELHKEIEDYNGYRKELQNIFDEMLLKNGVKYKWRMS